ncbi:MAG: serine/threonine-protein phosphatase [Clostridia bacterium]|nr:serine/threonine-protein phosphatase [Clostridia bacterium]
MKKKSSKKIPVTPVDTRVIARVNSGIVSIGNAQHQGARSYQEDSFGFSEFSLSVASNKGILAVLADGMGGLKNGKAVSDTVVSTLLEWFNSERSVCRTGTDLKNAISAINQKICDIYCKDGRIESGSTVVVALINNGFLHWLCIGDSRLYLKRDQNLYQINEDHDFLNQMLGEVIAGEKTLGAAYSDKQKDSLVGCIGKRDLEVFDYSKRGYRLEDGDILVLCSDGVYNAMTKVEFNMNISSDAMHSCDNIIKIIESKKLPNQDNNTIVILSYKEKGV